MIKTTTSTGIPNALATPANGGSEIHRVNALRTISLGCLLLLIVVAASAGVARAQLNIPVIRGDNGLKSGSQPGPGIYITGITYFYDTHEIVDRNGTRFNRVSIEQNFSGLALTYVPKKKILGANFSATVVLPLLNVAIDTPQSNSTSGIGYSDTYVQPLQLGWHKKRYDALVGYGFFAPTGKFTAGALKQPRTGNVVARVLGRRDGLSRRQEAMARRDECLLQHSIAHQEAQTEKPGMCCRSKVELATRSAQVCAT